MDRRVAGSEGIVPTISHLIGLSPPTQSQGAVLRDFLEGVEPIHQSASRGKQYAEKFEEELNLQDELKQIR
jgi:hypothetical protein